MCSLYLHDCVDVCGDCCLDVSASDSGGNTSRPMSNNLESSEQAEQVPVQPEVVVEVREQNLESVPVQPEVVVEVREQNLESVPVQPEVVVEVREQNLESVPEQPTSVVIKQEPVCLREKRMSSSGSMKGGSIHKLRSVLDCVVCWFREEEHP